MMKVWGQHVILVPNNIKIHVYKNVNVANDGHLVFQNGCHFNRIVQTSGQLTPFMLPAFGIPSKMQAMLSNSSFKLIKTKGVYVKG